MNAARTRPQCPACGGVIEDGPHPARCALCRGEGSVSPALHEFVAAAVPLARVHLASPNQSARAKQWRLREALERLGVGW